MERHKPLIRCSIYGLSIKNLGGSSVRLLFKFYFCICTDFLTWPLWLNWSSFNFGMLIFLPGLLDCWRKSLILDKLLFKWCGWSLSNFNMTLSLSFFLCVCVRVCAHTCVMTHVPQHAGGRQRTTCENCFFLCVMWDNGIKLLWSGLVGSAFTFWAFDLLWVKLNV